MPLLPIFAPIYQHQSARETELATVWRLAQALAPHVLVHLRRMRLTKSVLLRDGPVRESEGINGRSTAIWTRESPAYLQQQLRFM